MGYLLAFAIGGGLCALAQVVVDVTPLSPAHTMVLFVTLGALASGLGLYEPLLKLGGAGASVPLTGFGHVLVRGILREVALRGPVGLLSGGLTAAALGVTVAVLLGYFMAVLFDPKS